MDLEHKSIKRIKMASEMSLQYYGKPLVCAYSGGKDSDVMLELFMRSGVPFEMHHSHTTADAPPTVYHIRQMFRELELKGIKCTIDYHARPGGKYVTMWNLIPAKLFPPTRRVRYCCSKLKETGCANRMIATGVRWAESRERKGREIFETICSNKRGKIYLSEEKMFLSDSDDTRRLFEHCALKAKTVVNPIIDWGETEIFSFYRSQCRTKNPLYDMGYTRVGCIGCPMSNKKRRWREFSDFPKYKAAYIMAFGKMLELRKLKGKESMSSKKWNSGEDVFSWWMEDDNVPGQMCFEDFMAAVW